PGRARHRARERRLRRGVPGAAGDGGLRAGPPRLRRRGAGRRAVRGARGDRPAAGAVTARGRRGVPAVQRGAGRGRPGPALRGGAALAAHRRGEQAPPRPQGGRAGGARRGRPGAVRGAGRAVPAVGQPRGGARRRRRLARLRPRRGAHRGRVPRHPEGPAPARLSEHQVGAAHGCGNRWRPGRARGTLHAVLTVAPHLLRPWFTPERPGPLVYEHVTRTGHGTVWVDRWPDPRVVVAEVSGNLSVRGDPARVGPEALARFSGFVDAPPEWLPVLRASRPQHGQPFGWG